MEQEGGALFRRQALQLAALERAPHVAVDESAGVHHQAVAAVAKCVGGQARGGLGGLVHAASGRCDSDEVQRDDLGLGEPLNGRAHASEAHGGGRADL